MIRAVLDTNVLISALLSPFGNESQALDAVQTGKITPCFSNGILEEYAEVLARPKFGFAREEIEGLVDLLKSKGLLFETARVAGTSPDPGDEQFIGCALEASAEFLVTGKKRHFPEKSCGRARVVSARELMELLKQRKS